jgi:rare lipoprotein A
MILETLRNAVILSTVLTNVVSLGTPAEHIDKPIQPIPAAPARLVPVAAETASLTSLASLRRPEAIPADFPTHAKKLKKTRTSFIAGLASWYGDVFDGRPTASGEIFDQTLLTCASNILPLGTRVKVTNLRNGQSVVVRVNDRGLLPGGRVVDLSSGAADSIGMLQSGVAPVRLDILRRG